MIAIVAALAFLIPLQGGPEGPQGFVLKNMVRFDQAYIPALAFTKQNNAQQSRQAIAALRRAWNDFRRQNFGWVRDDAEGTAGFAAIDSKILTAEETIAYGRRLSEAHEALEGIRTTLLQIRRRHGMDYYPDLLTDFHGPMEKMVQAVKDKEPAGLSSEEIESIKATLEMARPIWKRVADTQFDAALYQFDEKAVSKLKEGIEGVETSLESLSVALAEGDQSKIIELVRSLQPGFARVYLLFGGFQS